MTVIKGNDGTAVLLYQPKARLPGGTFDGYKSLRFIVARHRMKH